MVNGFGFSCCNKGCTLEEVTIRNPTNCNETMDSAGGFTDFSNPPPLFVGSMQLPPDTISATARKDMSIDLLTFTRLEIQHSSFVPEFIPHTQQTQSSVFYNGLINHLSYSGRHVSNGPFNLGNPVYSYSMQFRFNSLIAQTVTASSVSASNVSAGTEVDFRGLLTVNSRMFEEDDIGRCLMKLDGTIEFFINGVLDQSDIFSTQLEQRDLNDFTNRYVLTSQVQARSDPTLQGVNSVQVTVS